VIEKLSSDWLRQFARRSEAKPIRVGSRTIVIPAEAAFGTGEHATTAMSLRMLERVTKKWPPGWKMLDAGTGSGILAIAGRCFGAGIVLAMDNDPIAVRIAQRNARTNGVPNIRFEVADVLKQKLRGRFDVITANLFSEIVITALPKWSRHLARDGCVILSGILRSEEATLIRALRRNAFFAREIRRRGKWIAVLAIRDEEKG
jgi:ribosomal protein L11 methyltransferase